MEPAVEMAPPKSKLIVNYLPQQMSGEELYSMFITIGPIETCRLMTDHNSGYSYGFGFVTYVNPEDAARAIEKLNGQAIYRKRIKVSYARESSTNIKETNLYITQLPRYYNEMDLENLFRPYGKIIQKKLLHDKYTKRSRGIAFVRFDKRDEAKSAIENLDGKIPEGGNEALSVRVAEEYGKQRVAYFAGQRAAFEAIRHATLRGGRTLNISGRGGMSEVSRGGRGMAEVSRGGRGMFKVIRGGRGFVDRRRTHGSVPGTSYMNMPVAYPIRGTNGLAPIRRELTPVRYNPTETDRL